MSNLVKFKQAVAAQFAVMSAGTLFTSDATREGMWDTYINSFPEGSNPIFRERTEHDCNCCKSFIRQMGNVVAFVDGELVSIWDIEIGGDYQVVADALAAYVSRGGATGIFLHDQNSIGTDKNLDTDSPSIEWNHFFCKLPAKVVKRKDQIATLKGQAVNNYTVLKRSVEEITPEAVETVMGLIDSNVLYRGTEQLSKVTLLQQLQASNMNQEQLWLKSIALGETSAIRNSVVGVLMVDLSKGKDLEQAVSAYEKMTAPANYKRSSALITQGMIDKAHATTVELGLESALERRYANITDISINDVKWADNLAKKDMGAFGALQVEATAKKVDTSKATDITIEDFMANVVPKATSMELLVENSHNGNFMSLIAPVHADAGSILKWNNNFSWSYNGEVTDSMKETVKSFGGKTTGALRFSIQWNDKGDNSIDFDAHAHMGNHGHIYYGSRRAAYGELDVDIMSPGKKVAVENIIFDRISADHYAFRVHNYSSRSSNGGFTAEVEFNGEIHSFTYAKNLRGGEYIDVAKVTSKNGVLTLVPAKGIVHGSAPITVWGVTSKSFHRVETLMLSPNHWEGEACNGNLHYMFMLEGCVNPAPARGFYNEFLKPELHDHRKVFEVLGSKLKAPHTPEQLSGLGFSSTQRASVICRVRGSINKDFQINF